MNPRASPSVKLSLRMAIAVLRLAALFHTGCAIHASSDVRKPGSRTLENARVEDDGCTDRASHLRWGMILADENRNVSHWQASMPRMHSSRQWRVHWQTDNEEVFAGRRSHRGTGFKGESMRSELQVDHSFTTSTEDAASSFSQPMPDSEVGDADFRGDDNAGGDAPSWNDHDDGEESDSFRRTLFGGKIRNWWNQWRNRTNGGIVYDTVSCSNTGVQWHMPIGDSSGGGGGWRPKWWPFKKNSNSTTGSGSRSSGKLTSRGKLAAHCGMLAGESTGSK